eukprot:jgi/Hompol1/5099/HPOL_001898-RA
MGQTLSEPVTEKHSTKGEDDQLAYGASAMQGWRISTTKHQTSKRDPQAALWIRTMEDAHTTILNLSTDPSERIAFFAVFDGHGGKNVAQFCGSQVHHIVSRTAHFQNKNYGLALKKGYLDTDVELRNDPNFAREQSGCTAISVIITDTAIYSGNAGDSRAVLSTGGRAEPLSHDHKPNNPEETQRILQAGGFVEFNRVNGIWDCMSNQEVIDFVSVRISERYSLDQICEQLMDRCLAPDSGDCGVGCDNMTVVIVGLLRGLTMQAWQSKVAARIAAQGGLRVGPVIARRMDPASSAFLPSYGVN